MHNRPIVAPAAAKLPRFAPPLRQRPALPFSVDTPGPRAQRPRPPPPAPPHRPEARPEQAPRPEAPQAAPDPLERALMQLRPPSAPEPAAPQPPQGSLCELVDRLLRKIALGGNRHRGTARLELAGGSLRSVTIHADEGELRVELSGPDDEATRSLRASIGERLRRRGLQAQVELVDGH